MISVHGSSQKLASSVSSASRLRFLRLSFNPANPGSADTMHRLQTAHSFWTSQPAVFPDEYPEFGVHGRGGRLYDWYGIGQPLLMLPFDVTGTYLEKLPIFGDYNGDPAVRNIFVSYATNILISVLTALVCFRLLGLLGFDLRQSVVGVLALLFCTTRLHYGPSGCSSPSGEQNGIWRS